MGEIYSQEYRFPLEENPYRPGYKLRGMLRCPLGAQMAQDGTERWRELCAKAAVEEDSDKLYDLIAEILAFFDAREKQQDGKEPLFRD